MTRAKDALGFLRGVNENTAHFCKNTIDKDKVNRFPIDNLLLNLLCRSATFHEND